MPDTTRGSPHDGHHGAASRAGLHRERLTRVLDRLPSVRLGLVVAPAGSGKTTLLAHWSHTSQGRVALYRVSREDTGTTLLTRIADSWGLPMEPGADAHGLLARMHARDEPRVLVLDDVHALTEACARTAVAALVREAPPNTAVLLASRRMPNLDLVHSEVSNNPVVLGQDDLRFRSWEVESLFRDVYQAPLSPDQAAALARHTAGWAAALHLFHLSTAGLPKTGRQHAIQAMAGHSRNRYARGYLSEQVLSGLGSERSEFMRRTAVFEVLTARRCDALLRQDGSQAILEELVAQQALTTTDDDGETFRYHEVLRRHLEADLGAELGESGLRDWCGGAADLLEAEGAVVEALRLRARARNWPGVRSLLVRFGQELTRQQGSWTGLLPESMLRDDPWVELAEAQRLLGEGLLTQAGAAARSSRDHLDDPRVDEIVRELLAVVRAWEQLDCPPTQRWFEQVAEGMRHLKGSHRAPATVHQAQQDAMARPFLAMLQGNVRGAREALHLAEPRSDNQSPTALALGLASALAAFLAGETGARELAETVAAQSELDDVGWFTRASRALLAATDPNRGRGAQDLQRVIVLCDSRSDAWGAAWAAALAGLHAMSRDDAVPQLDLADARLRGLGAVVPAAWMSALAAFAQARTSPADGADRARSAVEAAQEVGCQGAQAVATAALARAENDPALLRSATAMAHNAGVTPWEGWSLDPLAPVDGAPITAVAITLLGRFEIRVNGGAVDLSDLRPQPRQLLQLLALHAGEPLHRERLAEDMWPSQPLGPGIHRLHVAMSTLRRRFEDVVAPGTGPVIAREGECYRLCLPEGSVVDIQRFRTALDRVRMARRAGAQDAERTSLLEALDLYDGDLLPEAGPAEWLVRDRDQLRSEAGAAAARLAEILAVHDPRAAVAAAELSVGLDSFNDAAWQRLIDLHEELGDLAQAQRARSSYEIVLRDLGVVPPISESAAG